MPYKASRLHLFQVNKVNSKERLNRMITQRDKNHLPPMYNTVNKDSELLNIYNSNPSDVSRQEQALANCLPKKKVINNNVARVVNGDADLNYYTIKTQGKELINTKANFSLISHKRREMSNVSKVERKSLFNKLHKVLSKNNKNMPKSKISIDNKIVHTDNLLSNRNAESEEQPENSYRTVIEHNCENDYSLLFDCLREVPT